MLIEDRTNQKNNVSDSNVSDSNTSSKPEVSNQSVSQRQKDMANAVWEAYRKLVPDLPALENHHNCAQLIEAFGAIPVPEPAQLIGGTKRELSGTIVVSTEKYQSLKDMGFNSVELDLATGDLNNASRDFVTEVESEGTLYLIHKGTELLGWSRDESAAMAMANEKGADVRELD